MDPPLIYTADMRECTITTRQYLNDISCITQNNNLYSYLIDGADGSRIAPGCARVMGAGAGNRCNFNQFIQYINGVSTPVSISSDAMPDIDSTARALNDAQLTGQYEVGRVFPGTANDIATLLSRVGDFVSGNVAKASNSQLANARTAIDRVRALRGAANLDAVSEMLSKAHPGIKIVTLTKSLYSGGPPLTTLNTAATIKANPGLDIKGDIDAMNKADPAHIGNANAASLASAKVQGCSKK